MKQKCWRTILLATSGLLWPVTLVWGQAVSVSAVLDTNSILGGQTTYLRISAQVLPAFRAGTDRIFSWYVDVLNTNGTVASAGFAAMQKPASDNDSQTSSTGFADGAHRRGIYDTFLNHAGAGVSNAVPLMVIPVMGLRPGRTRFVVQAGSGVPALSSDFLVALTNGGELLVGGEDTAAHVDLEVRCAPIQLQLSAPGGIGPGQTLRLNFNPCPGMNHTVQYRDALGDLPGWQSLPGGPHNTGQVTVTNAGPRRFFRVQTTSP